jgi:SHS2 domain-containing protein
MGSFEFFDHTADVGMRVRANTLEDLLATAVRGMMHLMMPDAEELTASARYEVALEESEPALVLFDLLNEALYRFAVERFVVVTVGVDRRPDGSVRAELAGTRLAPDVAPGGCEVKAVTYHGLSAAQDDAGWTAEVIFDI